MLGLVLVAWLARGDVRVLLTELGCVSAFRCAEAQPGGARRYASDGGGLGAHGGRAPVRGWAVVGRGGGREGGRQPFNLRLARFWFQVFSWVEKFFEVVDLVEISESGAAEGVEPRHLLQSPLASVLVAAFLAVASSFWMWLIVIGCGVGLGPRCAGRGDAVRRGLRTGTSEHLLPLCFCQWSNAL